MLSAYNYGCLRRVKLSGTCHLAVVFGTAAVYPWLMVAGFNGSLWQQLVHAR
jgi:hypothetical protein